MVRSQAKKPLFCLGFCGGWAACSGPDLSGLTCSDTVDSELDEMEIGTAKVLDYNVFYKRNIERYTYLVLRDFESYSILR